MQIYEVIKLSKNSSFLSILVSIFVVIIAIGRIANWNLEDIQEIVIDMLAKSLMTMTAIWLILATSSTSILHRGSAPRLQAITLLFLSLGGLGLVELLNVGVQRATLETITVQWAGLIMGSSIVLFTVLAIVTGREEEEDPLLAIDK